MDNASLYVPMSPRTSIRAYTTCGNNPIEVPLHDQGLGGS